MFEPFAPGTVHHPFHGALSRVTPPRPHVTIRFPSRLNAMAIDPSAIAADRGLVYDAGEVVFSVARYRVVRVRRRPRDAGLAVTPSSPRPLLIRHAALLTCAALGVPADLEVDLAGDALPAHAGFGSSSSIIAAVAAAVNHLEGEPIAPDDLLPYLTSNHGEERDHASGLLTPVQCIGGSAASGLLPGGAQVVAGRSVSILRTRVPAELSLVIGLPPFVEQDAGEMLAREMAHFDAFRETGERYGREIAYRMLHEAIPAATRGDLAPLGRLVFDYRFRMGSIENCAFSHPGLVELARKVEPLWHDGLATVLSLSSVGPAFFALTAHPDACASRFLDSGLQPLRAAVHNGRYEEVEGGA